MGVSLKSMFCFYRTKRSSRVGALLFLMRDQSVRARTSMHLHPCSN